MKKNTFVLALAAILILPAAGMAQQEQYGFTPGSWELTLQGSGNSEDDFDNTIFDVQAGLGYFLTKSFELGIRQGMSWVDPEGGSDRWDFSTRAFLDYHFDYWMFQPFAGINFGYLYGDDVNESWIGGVEGGIKVFLQPGAFLFFLLEYNELFEDGDEGDAFEDGRWVYALGIGIGL